MKLRTILVLFFALTAVGAATGAMAGVRECRRDCAIRARGVLEECRRSGGDRETCLREVLWAFEGCIASCRR